MPSEADIGDTYVCGLGPYPHVSYLFIHSFYATLYCLETKNDAVKPVYEKT